jgi:hypothetical protein
MPALEISKTIRERRHGGGVSLFARGSRSCRWRAMTPGKQRGTHMIGNFVRVITTCTIVLGLGSSAALAQPDVRFGHNPPPVPANIEVPAGYSVFFNAHAIGTQNYVCLPAASGVAWKFMAPQATLFHASHGEISQQLATHFLSANAAENGLPRPTWQHSLDSSRVWARALASSTDPNYVEAGAIPWLLLTVVGAEDGPDGGSFLTKAVFIQRLNTSGGAAPSTGCSQSTEIGALALVPYAADYIFYRAPRVR